MPLNFTAIDFETANSHGASACSVGLVRVRSGVVVAQAGWLIKPPPGFDDFQPRNMEIHGIHPADVADARSWSQQLSELSSFAGADVLVAHNAGFDMSVIKRACEVTGDECPPYQYVCSVQVARRVYDLESYALPFAAAAAGFTELSHHNATSDALASAHVIIDSAKRVGAYNITQLAERAGVRVGQIDTKPSASAVA